ncbi:Methyltransferase domain protein [Candidatus Anstonella stagnisolia]|nr:Methyltransferase domain protein [Candidatus Anstonella stagnisolia]
MGTLAAQPCAPNFAVFNDAAYRKIIGSPSASREYFERFHKPLLEELQGGCCKNGMCTGTTGKKVLLDIACGHGHELEFLKDGNRIKIIGLELSRDVLLEYTRKSFPDAFFVAADVRASPLKHEFADAAIAANAVIYEQWEMLQVIFNSLKEGAKAVVNFTLLRAEEELGKGLLDTGAVSTVKVNANGREFRLRALDFSHGHADEGRLEGFVRAKILGPSLKSVGTQVHFRSIEDVEGFVQHAGFLIVGHETFQYANESGVKETEVYTLQKPRAPR